MADSTVTTTPGPGQQFTPDQMQWLWGQIQGAQGQNAGGADTGQLTGVGDYLMNLAQQGGTPNAQQQGGLNSFQQATDMGNLQRAYQNYFGAVAGPTIGNNAIASGLGQGAANENIAMAGAQAGTQLAGMQNQALQNFGNAQIGLGNQLYNQQYQPAVGAAGAYQGAGALQNQAALGNQGQHLNFLSQLFGSVLGGKGGTAETTSPFFPTNLMDWGTLAGQGLRNVQWGDIKKLFGTTAPATSTGPAGTADSPWTWGGGYGE